VTTLHFDITIAAPRPAVWDALLSDATYREWTAEFTPGSYFVGDWSEGSRMRFLGPGADGESGMVSRVLTNRLHEQVVLEHVGLVENGREDTTSDAVQAWAGARETYTLQDVDGGTRVVVTMDTTDEYREMFDTVWPKALRRLGELVEGQRR
jgi:uncharacterized protein YndB with AHSA1/START domain